MKVTTAYSPFDPVTIVLQSQIEVDALYEALANVITVDLLDGLREHQGHPDPAVVEGNISIDTLISRLTGLVSHPYGGSR